MYKKLIDIDRLDNTNFNLTKKSTNTSINNLKDRDDATTSSSIM